MSGGFWSRYLGLTVCYGVGHMIPAVWWLKWRMYNERPGEAAKDVLVVDKALLVMLVGGAGPVLWPLMLREDLVWFECWARGKAVSEYIGPDPA
jgi:hypothetical protein